MKIKRMKFKSGDCFVGADSDSGVSVVRIIKSISGKNITYSNNCDKQDFTLTKYYFRFVLQITDSKYLGNMDKK